MSLSDVAFCADALVPAALLAYAAGGWWWCRCAACVLGARCLAAGGCWAGWCPPSCLRTQPWVGLKVGVVEHVY